MKQRLCFPIERPRGAVNFIVAVEVEDPSSNVSAIGIALVDKEDAQAFDEGIQAATVQALARVERARQVGSGGLADLLKRAAEQASQMAARYEVKLRNEAAADQLLEPVGPEQVNQLLDACQEAGIDAIDATGMTVGSFFCLLQAVTSMIPEASGEEEED